MDQLVNHCGFDDALFIGNIPDYFHCVVCQLVLHQPKQILTCGHKMCATCFQRYQAISEKSSNILVCPVDKKILNPQDVVLDVRTESSIGNLRVICSNKNNGCIWEGYLGDLLVHLDKCQAKRITYGNVTISEDEESLKHLFSRIEKIEGFFAEQKKELAHSKGETNKVKEDLENLRKEKDMEVNFLKEQVKKLRRKLIDVEREPEEIDGGSEASKKRCRVMEQSQVNFVRNPKMRFLKPFMLIEIDGIPYGKICFNLFTSKAPQTCKKFVSLCTHEYGVGYKGATFCDVWAGGCQVCVRMSDTPVRSYPGTCCPDNLCTPLENLTSKHDEARLVTMEPRFGCEYTHTSFSILNEPNPDIDGKYTIIGEVTKCSWRAVEKMIETKIANEDKWVECKIVDCGMEEKWNIY